MGPSENQEYEMDTVTWWLSPSNLANFWVVSSPSTIFFGIFVASKISGFQNPHQTARSETSHVWRSFCPIFARKKCIICFSVRRQIQLFTKKQVSHIAGKGDNSIAVTHGCKNFVLWCLVHQKLYHGFCQSIVWLHQKPGGTAVNVGGVLLDVGILTIQKTVDPFLLAIQTLPVWNFLGLNSCVVAATSYRKSERSWVYITKV